MEDDAVMNPARTTGGVGWRWTPGLRALAHGALAALSVHTLATAAPQQPMQYDVRAQQIGMSEPTERGAREAAAQLAAITGGEFAILKPGDSLALLALRAGRDPKRVAWINGLETIEALPAPAVICLDRAHRVLPGETAARIASMYGCPPDELRAHNALSADEEPAVFSRLAVPAFLDSRLPGAGPWRVQAIRPDVGSVSSSVTGVQVLVTHRVADGDTLDSVAAEHGVTAEQLMLLNRRGEDRSIPAGQTLAIECVQFVDAHAELGAVVSYLEQWREQALEDLLALNGVSRPGHLLGRWVRCPVEPIVEDPFPVHQVIAIGGEQIAFELHRGFGNVIELGGRIAAEDEWLPLEPLELPQIIDWEQEWWGAEPVAIERIGHFVPLELGGVAGEFEGAPARHSAEAEFWGPEERVASGVRPVVQRLPFPKLAAEFRDLPLRERVPTGVRGLLDLVELTRTATLRQLADELVFDVDRLIQWNAVDADSLLPAGTAVVLGVYDRCLPGETLDDVAARHGEDVREVRSRNELAVDASVLAWTRVELEGTRVEAQRDSEGVLSLVLPVWEWVAPAAGAVAPWGPWQLENEHHLAGSTPMVTLATDLGVSPEDLRRALLLVKGERLPTERRLRAVVLRPAPRMDLVAAGLWLEQQLGVELETVLALSGLESLVVLPDNGRLIVPLDGFPSIGS